MNSRQLEVFRAVMRHRTLTDAARALNVSQPAISKVLLHAEDQLGIKLFERVKGRLLPTLEAETLFPDADRVFRELDALRRQARNLKEGKLGLLRIAATAPPSFSVVPQAIRSFHASFPGVKLITHILPSDEISQKIIAGDIDIGITLSPLDLPMVDIEVLGSTHAVAVMHKDHPLAAQKEVAARELQDGTLISYNERTILGRLLEDAFQRQGLRRHVDIEISLSIAALPLVTRGVGVALVDGLIAWHEFSDIVVRPFVPKVTLNIMLVTGRTRPMPHFAKEFARHLRKAGLAHERARKAAR